MTLSNYKVEIAIIILLFGGIMGWILIPPLFADTTIFLTTENGGTPQSCAPANGLVLAQNLTDLCDVTIISPSTDQIIKYNGSQWVNVAQATFSNESTSCNNIGIGDAFICVENTNVNLRSVLSGSGISVSNNSNTITVNNTGVLSFNDGNLGYGLACDPITGTGDVTCDFDGGGGRGISLDGGPSITFNTNFKNGTGISITTDISNGTQTFTNTAPESTVCANVGTGSQIYKDGNCNFRSILGSPDISVTQQANTVTIDYNGTLASESTVCSGQSGNYNIVASSSGGNCTFKNLLSGTGMSLSSNGTHITITNSSPESTICSSAGGTTIVKTSSGGNCTFYGLTAGTGLTLTQNTNDNNYKTNFANGTAISITGTTTQTFTNISPESTSCTGQSGNHNIVASSSGGNCTFKNLVAGTGISISNNSTHITITSTVSGESTTCTNLGTGTILCSGGNVNIKTLKAGLGLSISNTTNDVTYKTNFVNGTGISITGSTSQTFTNTGVISNSCSGAIACSGTNPSTFTFSGAVKICNVVAAGGETTLTCTFSPTTFKSFIMQSSFTSTQADTWVLRFNGDGGNNYNIRSSTNGGADATSGATGNYATVTITANQWYNYDWQCNEPLSGQEKHCYGFRTTSANGAGNADARVEFASKWANTASVITDTELVRTAGTGTMTAGSFITVWGISQ